jgi:hypothetical protein
MRRDTGRNDVILPARSRRRSDATETPSAAAVSCSVKRRGKAIVGPVVVQACGVERADGLGFTPHSWTAAGAPP